MIESISELQRYNLDDDPGETTNLAPEPPEVVSNLMKRIQQARAEFGDIDRSGVGVRFFDDGP